MFNNNALKSLMYEKEMTAAQLSKLTGIPKNTLGYYLKGKAQPKADRVRIIAEALEVSVDLISSKHVDESYDTKTTLTLAETSKMLCCSVSTLKEGIINDQWNPSIGSAIQMENGSYRFHIPKKRVENYLGIGINTLAPTLTQLVMSYQTLTKSTESR